MSKKIIVGIPQEIVLMVWWYPVNFIKGVNNTYLVKSSDIEKLMYDLNYAIRKGRANGLEIRVPDTKGANLLCKREVFLLLESIGGPAEEVYVKYFRGAFHMLEHLVKRELNIVGERILTEQEVKYNLEPVDAIEDYVVDRSEYMLYLDDEHIPEDILDNTNLPPERHFTVGGVTLTFILVGESYKIYSHELAKVFDKGNTDVMKTYHLIIDELNQFRNKSKVKNDEGTLNGDLKRGASTSTGTDDNNAVSKQLPINKTSYIDKQDKERPALLLNRRAVFLIISRMRGIAPLNYMNDFYTIFEQLEKAVVDNALSLTRDTLIELRELKHTATLLEQNADYMREQHAKMMQAKLEEIEKMIPKYELGDKLMSREDDLDMLAWALYFTIEGESISRNELLILLRKLGYIQKTRTLAVHRYVKLGLFRIVESIDAAGSLHTSTLVTSRGIANLTPKIQSYLNLP